MTADIQRSILGLALLAAFADGDKDDGERSQVRRLADQLSGDGDPIDVPRLMQDVLLGRFTVDGAAASLTEPGHRRLAYEMAVCVCDADGLQTDAERRFLTSLRLQLGLEGRRASESERQAEALAALIGPSEAPAPALPADATGRGRASEAVSSNGPDAPSGVAGASPRPATVPEAEIDKSILNYALLTGALEMLPQSWASMAIIPLQMKMVYAIGQVHGIELDRGHVREFIAAAGVGMTSQYLEQFGRKLLGGLLGKALGRTAGRLGRAATGVAFSFATTYALGQLAKRYYAGGRQMTAAVLQETFESLIGPAREMQERYLPQIRQKAATLDAASVMKIVKP